MLTGEAKSRSHAAEDNASSRPPDERAAIEIVRPSVPLQDQTILCFASNYFFDPTSKHHVMRELAKTRHVLWVNWHASRRPSLNGRDLRGIVHKLKQIGQGVTKVTDRLWVMTPFVLPLPSSRIARRLNRLLVALQLRWVLRSYRASPALEFHPGRRRPAWQVRRRTARLLLRRRVLRVPRLRCRNDPEPRKTHVRIGRSGHHNQRQIVREQTSDESRRHGLRATRRVV